MPVEQSDSNNSMRRRKFLQLSALAAGGTANLANADTLDTSINSPHRGSEVKLSSSSRKFNEEYSGAHIEHIAFPLGGIGAGMICLEGTGSLSHFSIRNNPEMFNQPLAFAAIAVKGKRTIARVLEGPVP